MFSHPPNLSMLVPCRLTSRCLRHQPRTARSVYFRDFNACTARRTDGVYKALTEMRVRTPWIQALRDSQEATTSSPSKQVVTPDTKPKKMSDSYVSVVLPLAQDLWMLDTYANYTGQIRTGTLLMDLDALAGVVAYKHTGEGVSTVTAAVDRITIKNPLKDICDIELSGQVTFATGRSSMEISIQVAKAPEKGQQVKPEDVYMTCAFTMVSLHPVTKKPVNIAPLELTNPAERALFQKGEENYKNKKLLKTQNIMQKAPDAEESDMIHKMWIDSLAYQDSKNPAKQPTNTISMGRTTIHTTQIMQPQYRNQSRSYTNLSVEETKFHQNRHNFMVFGGYLLKQTFELAFTCASAFSHTRVKFLNLDPSTFEEPVPVGSVLYVGAGITYTESDPNGGTRIQVMVRTHVRNVEHAENQRKETGTFFYTFHSPAEVTVLPQTYSEFMKWVAGKRRANRLATTLEAEGKTDGQYLLQAGTVME